VRRQRHRWWFILVLIWPLAISGCHTSRPSSTSSLTDNGRFMDTWGIYTHCSRSEDLDAMRVDAQRLSLAGNMTNSAGDPSAMAAACALRAGHLAQERGRRSFAREMFQMIVTNFPQPRYRYYVGQAREGLERLDAEPSG
jgi:hypothetical protein